MKVQTQHEASSQRRRRRKKKPNRLYLFLYNRLLAVAAADIAADATNSHYRSGMMMRLAASLLLVTFIAIAAYVCLWIFRHAQCYSREAGVVWKEAPIHAMYRPCPSNNFGYQTMDAADASFESSSSKSSKRPRICMTTLTDKKSSSSSLWQRLLRCRDFDQVATLTWPNHARYAQLHNYTIVDASDLMDTSRPPAWSKILAVLQLLDRKTNTETETTNSVIRTAREQQLTINACDWVLWLDADVVIMNSSIALESILPAGTKAAASPPVDSSLNNENNDINIDLIVTMDRRFTANSGVWLMRNSNYSRNFLKTWWNMRTWVREPGLSLSGDNAAFGHLIEQELLHQSKNQQQQQQDGGQQHQHQHVVMIPRCIMNSFGAFVTPTELEQLNKNTTLLQQHEFVLNSQNYYHAGDFIAHASGIDQKAAGVQMLLNRAT
jgi:galactosyl transferase GMA12/MNN10 family